MIKEVLIAKDALQLKSVSIHRESIMGVTMTDDIIILGYIPEPINSSPIRSPWLETPSAPKPRRGRPKSKTREMDAPANDQVALHTEDE